MKILIIHNRYIQQGGEDIVFKEESNLLKQKGHEVIEHVVSNKNMDVLGVWNKIKVGINTIWSIKNYIEVKSIVGKLKPDIVHIHNTFPQLSPSIYWAIKSHKTPIVQTVHNYRLACVNGFLFRGNNICETCLSGSIFNSIKKRCYRDSFLATTPITIMLLLHRLIKTFEKKVDKYIVLTKFQKDIMERIGIDDRKLIIKPNFTTELSQITSLKEENRKKQLIYVGRISKEKGLDTLLEAFEKNNFGFDLVLVGDGPYKETLLKKYNNNNRLKWLGHKDKNDVKKLIRESYCLVMPSSLYETFGMVLIESFSVGTPVIAPNHGGFPYIVQDEINGFLFKSGDADDLGEKINYLINNADWIKLSSNSIKSYIENYTSDINYKYLIQIYNSIINKQK